MIVVLTSVYADEITSELVSNSTGSGPRNRSTVLLQLTLNVLLEKPVIVTIRPTRTARYPTVNPTSAPKVPTSVPL